MATVTINIALSPNAWTLFNVDMLMHYAEQELRKLALALFPKTVQAFYGDATVHWNQDDRLFLKRVKVDIIIDNEMDQAASEEELTALGNKVSAYLAETVKEKNMGKVRIDTSIKVVLEEPEVTNNN